CLLRLEVHLFYTTALRIYSIGQQYPYFFDLDTYTQQCTLTEVDYSSLVAGGEGILASIRKIFGDD
ncbi:MAG: hypothetical protein AAGL17_13485, partial [Cyanobacteria bacterium J06576_12]